MMTTTRYSKPSEFLEVIDSHGIYNAEMLKECEFETDTIPRRTVKQTRRDIEHRDLGGSVEGDENDQLFYGWSASEALAARFLGEPTPGARFQGRGSLFRANLEALKEAGL
jgi:hypothetical protein